MRARVAYISSFGTTTILVAAALLILAVGGALVAFNGWPGAASNAKVDSVSLDPAAPARAATPARARPAAARPAARPAATPARPASRRATSTAGLVKRTPVAGPGSVVPGIVMIQDDRVVVAPDPAPPAAQESGGPDNAVPAQPGEAPRIVDPNELPDAGGLLPVGGIPLPPPPPVVDLGGVAGPGGVIDPVTMVGDIIAQVPLPPLP
jgi:pyruvate/2-oxoglutarate dehydrogenase complex dihydrolipoamide acyltransferase (E2) component